MLSYKTNILVDNTIRNLEKVFEIIKFTRVGGLHNRYQWKEAA